MKKLFCAATVGPLFALCLAACSAPSNTNQPTVVANSNQAVVANANTAVVTTANSNTTAPPTIAANTSAPPAANANNSNAATPTTATPAKATTTAAAADFTATRAQYAKHCAACHGAGGEGLQMAGVNYPSLKTGTAVSRSDAQLNNYITNGHEGMPAFKGKLSADQIATMVRYIRQEMQGKK